MIKRIFKISVLIASLVILFNACSKKDGDNLSPVNETNGKTTAVFSSSITYGTLTDQDGNVYKTVTIGTQTWMAENLRTTKYNDGSEVSLVTENTAWINLGTGAYCNYNNTGDIDVIATNGRLYNWFAVKTGKLAPKGWHIPSESEWTTLNNNLKNEYELIETGNKHWSYFNANVTNSSGFTALPSGCREIKTGAFIDAGFDAYWWTSTAKDNSSANFCDLSMTYFFLGNYVQNQYGFSVRCVKD